MALPVEVLRALMDAGASPEAILAAAQAAEERQKRDQAEADRRAAEADEERRVRAREKNRERQRRWYDAHVRDNCDNAVSSQDNASNGVMQREDVRSDQQKKVLEPKKNNPSGINSSTPSGSQVLSVAKPRNFEWPATYREIFWSAYPRKTDRKKAITALDRVYRSDRVDFEAVMLGVEALCSACLEPRFIPHATTWLNGERWNDQHPGGGGGARSARASPSNGRSSPGSRLLDRMEARRVQHHHTDAQSDFGPVLDHEGDVRSDRQVYEPSGGSSGRFPSQAPLRLVGSGRH